MGVEADLGGGQRLFERGDAGGGTRRQQRSGGVHDIDAVAAVGFHQQGLLGEEFGRPHV